jgi:hypothetical protein
MTKTITKLISKHPKSWEYADPRKCQMKRQQGATTADFVGWGLLAALVIIGVAGMIYTGQRQQGPKTEAANIMSIYTAAKSQRNLQGYTALTTATLQRDGGFPSSMVGATGGGNVFHTWDGQVTVAGTATQFTITYAGVPADQCAPLRSALELAGNYVNVSACNAAAATNLVLTGR